MIKFKISYFYQIRFFEKNQLPISTAIWDPKWFHNFKNEKYIFYDKRRIINGLRFEKFNPQTSECTLCTEKDPSNCLFMKNYEKYLNSLNFNDTINELIAFSNQYAKAAGIEKDYEIILIVHEAPTNKCSEREKLIKWFSENNIILEEFTKK